MTKKTFNLLIERLGFSPKAAKLYMSALELGESTVQDLAAHSGVARTSIYYVLKELEEKGAFSETKRGKKIRYIAAEPRALLREVRDLILDAEDLFIDTEPKRKSITKKPRVRFLYGPSGFKQVWDLVFASPSKNYAIITDSIGFLDFVREKYLLDRIISKKRDLGVRSRQIITDTTYTKKIVAKDKFENRQSRFLPFPMKLPFTEIIADDLVAFIPPERDYPLFVIENPDFVETRRNIFDSLWQTLPKP